MSSDMRLDYTYEEEYQYWSYDICIIPRGFSIIPLFYSRYRAVPYLLVPSEPSSPNKVLLCDCV